MDKVVEDVNWSKLKFKTLK